MIKHDDSKEHKLQKAENVTKLYTVSGYVARLTIDFKSQNIVGCDDWGRC